jgi:hypothetical protein
VTMTSCSTLELRPFESVTVNRTYLVPVCLNVNDVFTPVPRSDLSASSVHRYEHEDVKHTEADPSNETADPVTGADGLNSNDADGRLAAAAERTPAHNASTEKIIVIRSRNTELSF